MKTALLDTICPKCHCKLLISPHSFFCPECSKEYPVVNGIPILLKEDHLAIYEWTGQKSVSRLRNWLRRLVQSRPNSQCSTATRANVDFIAKQITPQTKLLFVGGGIHSYGRHMERLGASVLGGCINLEIAPGPIVDIVADGHNIPFPDGYFEVIICQAVLEHTRDSNRVVAEIYRVLKLNGLVYAEIPFIAPVHMVSDFRRYTLMGIQELFSAFEPIKSGVNGSVASSFAKVSINFFATLFSFGNSSLYQAGQFVFSWVFFPVKFLDWIFCKYPSAAISATAIYFMGTKRTLFK